MARCVSFSCNVPPNKRGLIGLASDKLSRQSVGHLPKSRQPPLAQSRPLFAKNSNVGIILIPDKFFAPTINRRLAKVAAQVGYVCCGALIWWRGGEQ